MANNFNRYWTGDQISPNEYQPAATPANPRSWPHHGQEQTFDPQGAPHLTETFDVDALPAAQEGNLRGADATIYERDGGPYNPMPEGVYASRETTGVEGTHRNVHGFASGQELAYNYFEVLQTTEPGSALNRSGPENPSAQNYGSPESPAESFIAPGLSPSLDDGGQYIRRSSSSRSQDQPRDLVICGNCGEKFRGKYANGNFTRHQKTQKCASSSNRKEWPCGACDKVYQRSDALLKHERRKHPNATGASTRKAAGDDS